MGWIRFYHINPDHKYERKRIEDEEQFAFGVFRARTNLPNWTMKTYNNRLFYVLQIQPRTRRCNNTLCCPLPPSYHIATTACLVLVTLFQIRQYSSNMYTAYIAWSRQDATWHDATESRVTTIVLFIIALISFWSITDCTSRSILQRCSGLCRFVIEHSVSSG